MGWIVFIIVALVVIGKLAETESSSKKDAHNTYVKIQPDGKELIISPSDTDKKRGLNHWETDYTWRDDETIDPNSFWGKTRRRILERDHFTCTECGSKINLSVHHKVALLLGGRNVDDNLTTLCKNCHEKIHKTHFFEDDFSTDVDNYGKSVHLTRKVKIISDAIYGKQKVEIDYTNARGIKSHRVIEPKNVMHGKDNKRIYVRAYCHKRNEDRTFRISRMTNLNVVAN